MPEKQSWTDLVLSNDDLSQHARLVLQLWTGNFASTTKAETERHAVQVIVLDFLENVVYKLRTGALEVTLVFEDVVNGVERFR